jgi:hypothetical protein
MTEFLDRGKEDVPTSLASLLWQYPAYHAPYVGYGIEVSHAKAYANYAYFQAVLPMRLQLISKLLRESGNIDVSAALRFPVDSGRLLAIALQKWATEEWRLLVGNRQWTRRQWLHSSRDKDDIVFSMLLDLAILLGEIIIRANSDWRWSLDMTEENVTDDMTSAHRIVLLADPVGDHAEPFVIDLEEIVVHRFLHADEPSQRLLNPLLTVVEQAIRGDYMAAWRAR